MPYMTLSLDIKKPVCHINRHFVVVAAAQHHIPRTLRKPQLVRMGVHERPARARVVDGEVFRFVNHGAAQRPRAHFLQRVCVAQAQGEGVGVGHGGGEIRKPFHGFMFTDCIIRQQAVIGKVIFVQRSFPLSIRSVPSRPRHPPP